MQKKNYSEPIKIKNPSAMQLPDITLTMEFSGTKYKFNGIYDGQRTVSSKLLRLMDNDENFTKGADKTDDER